MRAVSLSDNRIINILNGRFVPVFLSNEEFADNGTASPQEKAELRRIHLEGYAKKLSVGSVHAYVLDPDGHLMYSLHTVEAAKADVLYAMLQRTSGSLKISDGAPVIKPSAPAPPKPKPGELLLSLTTRYLERKGEEYALVQNAGGNWSALPSHEWIVLPAEKAGRLFPSRGPAAGSSWEPDHEVVSELLRHFFPPTENWELSTNRIDKQTLTATVERSIGGRIHARLTGSLTMKHPFYHKDDNKFVEATLAGYLEWNPAGHTLTALKLVTDRAEYRGDGSLLPFGAVVEMVPGVSDL